MRNSPELNQTLIPRDVQTSNTQGTPTQPLCPIPQLMMTPNPPNSCFPPTPKLPTNSNMERNMPMDLISNEAQSHLDHYSSLFEPTPNDLQEEPNEICLHLDPNPDITNPTLDLLIPEIPPSLKRHFFNQIGPVKRMCISHIDSQLMMESSDMQIDQYFSGLHIRAPLVCPPKEPRTSQCRQIKS